MFYNFIVMFPYIYVLFFSLVFFFFFNDTATTEIYTLSLHDALPIGGTRCGSPAGCPTSSSGRAPRRDRKRHTSELQSPDHLVCRLLLEKKKNKKQKYKKKKKKKQKTKKTKKHQNN